MLTYYAHKELEKYQGTEPTQGDWSQKSLQAQNGNIHQHVDRLIND